MPDHPLRPGEFELIARYFQPLATDPRALGLGDDAATIALGPGEDLVVKVDLIAEGIHFFPDDPAATVARKALRVNLSDLAAKGAEPFAYLLALALRRDWTEAWLAEFAGALAADQARYGLTLLGGDTSAASGGTTIAITAFGRLPAGSMVTRSGAKAGDLLFLSGTVGDAALGLLLRKGSRQAGGAGEGEGEGEGEAFLLDRYLNPQPRTELAPVIRRFASAAMDVSDGLLADLGHICQVSKVGAVVEAESLPLSPAARALVQVEPSLLATILGGGDDYEILAAVPGASAQAFRMAAASAGVAVAQIGHVLAEAGPPRIIDRHGVPIAIAKAGHVHF